VTVSPATASIRLLGISGSIRAQASNTALIGALAMLVPPGVMVTMYEGLAGLPHFNPDDERENLPPVVAELRATVGDVDGIVLSTPEYAHGLPGAFKNALDWLVGSVTFPGKPVMLLFASGASVHAPESLREILRTMSAVLVPEAEVTLELRGRSPRPEDLAHDPAVESALRAGLELFIRRIQALRG
jgi:chromate reductase, NAD(P)H dehydrogenase (quinone)